MRLLSLDFDYFFPIDPFRMDWGSSETGMLASMADMLWTTRAADVLRRGDPLPMTDGGERDFWARVTLTDDATIHVADSHFQIGGMDGGLLNDATSILSLDAHHDAGYTKKLTQWDCSNWCLRAHMASHGMLVTEVLYPRWRRRVKESAPVGRLGKAAVRRRTERFDGTPGKHLGTFDAVFLCRSGGWVPPWAEAGFFHLLDTAPRPIVKLPSFPERRPFDLAEAQTLADQWRGMMPPRQATGDDHA